MFIKRNDIAFLVAYGVVVLLYLRIETIGLELTATGEAMRSERGVIIDWHGLFIKLTCL